MASDNPNGAPSLPGLPIPPGADDQIQPYAQQQGGLVGGAPAEAAAARIDLRRYASALFRYKWMILLLVGLGTAGAFGVSQVLPEQYRTRATLWVEGLDAREAARGPIQSGNLLDAYGWVDLLRSYVVLDSVVLDERLYLSGPSVEGPVWADFTLKDQFRAGDYRLVVDPDGRAYRIETADGIALASGLVGDSIGVDLGFNWHPDAALLTPGFTAQFNVRIPREVSNELLDRLEVTPPQGHFMHVDLTGATGAWTARVLNAIADRLVRVAADLKSAKVEELSSILREQLVVAQQNLQTAEIELNNFRVQTIVLPSDRGAPVNAGLEATQDPVFSNFFSLQVDSDVLRRDREALERILRAWPTASEPPVVSLEKIGAVQESSELTRALGDLTEMRADLRSLQATYTDAHPEVVRLDETIRRQEREVVPELVRSVIQDLASREAENRDLLGSAGGELQEIPPRAMEEARLRRSVTIAENLYTSLRQRFEEARLAAASSIPDLRVLSPAVVPSTPSNDQQPRILLLGLAGSLGLAILLALVRDRMDPRIRYPEQVTAGLGLPILGGIPTLNGRNTKEQVLQMREAMRSIRMNLIHAHGTAGPLLVTVSSPGKSDGKSFVTSNLALAFAELGKRTLVVDGDVRRGTLHRIFEVQRVPGLTDWLEGKAPEQEVLRATENDNLKVVPSGTRYEHAPELLASPEMRQLLLGLRSDFDVILVDTPPLGAGADPFLLSTYTGSLVLVLRTGGTDQELAEANLQVLDRLPVRMLGVVLNGVPRGRAYRHYAYVPGYESHNEDQPARPKVISGA